MKFNDIEVLLGSHKGIRSFRLTARSWRNVLVPFFIVV